ncbi:MAG: ArnT family glycosyltransferase [Chloroflexota bacterium]
MLVLALVPRLLELRPTVTSDEGYWMQRTVRFGAALARGDLGQTYRSGHPGVTTMWVGLLGIGPERLTPFLPTRFTNYVTLQKHPMYLEAFFSARRAVAVTTALLLVGAAALAWRLLGPGPALMGGALIALDPYQVGSSQLLHVDTLLAPLMLVALLSGFNYWFAGRQLGYLLLTSAFIGLAVLTKAPGIALPIYLTFIGVLVSQPWKQGWGRFSAWVGCGVLSLVVYFACWPALWVEAPRRIPQLIRFAITVGGGPHNWPNYFLGQPITGDPGLLFYPIALIFRMSPVALVGLLALVFVHNQRRNRMQTLLALAGFVVFFMLLMNIGAKKFDRYLLPALMVISLLGGAGLWWFADRLQSIWIRAIVLTVPLALQASLLVQAQPYPLAAYNPLVGGAEAARRVLMVGWGEGLDQVADFLNAQPGAESLIAKTHYHHALRPMFRGSTVRVPDPTPVNYFVVYVNMAQRVIIPPTVVQIMAMQPPDFIAQVNGSAYAWVYRVDQAITPAPGTVSEDEDEE